MPNFFNYLSENRLSNKSKLLLLGSVSIAYLFELDNKSTLFMLLASVLIGEYYTLPKNTKPIQESNKRRIGFVESAMVIQEKEAEGACNVGGFMSIEGEMNIERFTAALIMVANENPLLHAKLDNKAQPPVLQLQDPDYSYRPLPLTHETVSDTFPSEKLEEILDAPYGDQCHYLWEVKLLINKNQTGPHSVVFKAHHVICDGVSVAIFMQALFSHYNNREKYNTAPLPFLKPSEDLVSKPTNWTRVLLNHIYLQLWEMIHYKTSTTYRPHNNPVKLFTQRKTKIEFSQFNRAELEYILAACRKHGTTLTALLTAALLQAEREIMGPLEIATISTPVSVRPFFSDLTPSGNHIGCYVADTILKIPVTQEMSLWDVAKKYKQELNALMPVVYPADFNAASWQLKIMKNAMFGNQTHFIKGISVSNAGKENYMADQDANAPLKLNAMCFCSSRRLGDKSIQISTVRAGDKLNFCFTYADPLLSSDNAEKIKAKTISILKNVIREEELKDSAEVNVPLNTRRFGFQIK